MSEEQTTQAVVDDVKTSAKPDATTDSARIDDLDAALKEFDAVTTTSSPPEQKPTTTTTDPGLAARLETLERERADERFRSAITPIVQKVRGDVPAEVFDDDEVIAWMDARAKKDPRLQSAWTNRDKNPQAWDRVVENLGREFGKKFAPRVDENVTVDRHAVTAAVRGASNKAPEGKATDYSGMSNTEFREAHKRDYGYYPPV